MSRIRTEYLDAYHSDPLTVGDGRFREEPGEGDDEEEDEGDRDEEDEDDDQNGGYSESPRSYWSTWKTMKREDFVKVAEEALDSLPEEFRSRIQNVAILVEDFPPNQSPRQPQQQRRLLLGIFHGVPATRRSVFDLSVGPAHIVLYQKNIEAVCSNEAEVRHQIRQTLMHELGHYFGMTEEQLRDV